MVKILIIALSICPHFSFAKSTTAFLNGVDPVKVVEQRELKKLPAEKQQKQTNLQNNFGDHVSALPSHKVLSIGYVPVVFPRDPVEANFVEEHTILGQILEPVLEANQNVGLDAGIAESWGFNVDGTIITLNLKKGRLFSNGHEITSKDVVYSIERHMQHSKSQSAQFLSDVASIQASAPYKVEIKLVKKNPAILKALTRDQLGIVPLNWKFDPHSNEPYIGSGPYRALRENGKWYLVKNQKFNGRHPAIVEKFELVFYKDMDFGIPDDILPDVIPDLSERALSVVTSHKKFQNEKYVLQNKLSFTQTSFWVYPTSPLYKNSENRIFFASVLDKAIIAYSEKKKFTLATGMIPIGIQGHLIKRPKVEDASNHNGKLKITIAFLPGVFGEFISDERTRQIFSENKIEINAVSFNPQTISKLPEQKPDIVTGSWAGGVNDPVGFLGLLNVLLNKSFDKYLLEKGIDLNVASLEEQWSLRAEKFRSVSEKTVLDGLIIPGWKTNTYFISKPSIVEEDLEIRYTPRFSNISVK